MTSRMFRAFAVACIAFGVQGGLATAASLPSFKDVLSVPTPDYPRISPDGSAIAYTLKMADWEHNRYDTELYVARRGETPKEITQGVGSLSEPRWSPDGISIAYTADGESGTQVYLVPAAGGTPRAVTALPGPVLGYDWSPDGKSMAVLLFEPPGQIAAARADQYGNFTVMGEEHMQAHLWLVDVAQALEAGGAKMGARGLHKLTHGPFSVTIFSVAGLRNSFSFSPDGKTLAFIGAPTAEILDAIRSYVGVVDLKTGAMRSLTPGPTAWNETPVFSPDGQRILFSRTETDDFPKDNKLLIVPVAGGAIIELKPVIPGIDHQPLVLGWQQDGIHVFFLDRTQQHVYRIDPDTGRGAQITSAPATEIKADFSADGRELAVLGFNGASAPDIYRVALDNPKPVRVSSASDALETWPHHGVEIVEWTSPDNVKVEGVLYTPAGMRPGTRAPLIVMLHGGPRELEWPTRLHNAIYPIEQWLDEGALVFFPNYRGSLGYGIEFERLPLRNIGHAEAVDIYSGIDHLAAAGRIDPARVGVAGHSWGGYLAAFVSTSGNRFKAALVDSGITDHRINYVMSNAGVADIGYLRSNPWRQATIWDSASPISYVSRARTPTLIMHGDQDPVVPVENAHELYRGLLDMGVPVRFVLFKDTEHNVARPKDQMTAMLLNWQWFERYLWQRNVALPWETSGTHH